MKQLHPRAVWLFFVKFLYLAVPISFFVGVVAWVIIPFIILFTWMWAKLTYKYYRYQLTEEGIKKEHGVIWKKYTTIPYDRVQNVDIYRGLLARLLGLSDLQVQTAGGISSGSYGGFSEGRLPGLSPEVAEQIRDELVKRVQHSKSQGL